MASEIEPMTLAKALAYLKPDPANKGTISLKAPKAREAVEAVEAAIAALRAQDRAGAKEMRAPKLRTPLTDAEREFIAEMSHEDDGRADRWQNFDPDFRQKDIARLLRLGWAERRERNGYREYRWTEAGRAALAKQEGTDAE